MAILGAQLVITLVMVSVIQKFTPHFSFAKWILCSTGLYRYLHPTDAELRTRAGIPKEKPTKSKGNHKHGAGDKNASSTFLVPRAIDIQLETSPVIQSDVVYLRYFTEYQWLLDFSLYAGCVYVISEVYHYYFPLKGEVNLSMVWCLLVVFFAFKLLTSLTVLYFQTDESIGERSMCIVAALVYLLVAMVVLIVDESMLETGLEDAYSSFNQSASKFLTEQGLPSSGPASKIVVKFFIAIGCGILGALFTFPGLRMAKMHWDSLKFCKEKRLLQILLNISFILPFILVILWIRPISRNYLTVRVFEGMEKPLLQPEAFETVRLFLVVLTVLLRFALMPIYLQSYLNIAHDRIDDLRTEAGRITNLEYQKKISSIFYYLCVVTLQFAAPLIICLFLTLMYKSLGGFSWTGVFSFTDMEGECTDDDPGKSAAIRILEQIDSGGDQGEDDQFNILESAQNIQISWTSLKSVFTTEVFKGFLGFATWWSYFTLFATSSLGILYQSYFTKT